MDGASSFRPRLQVSFFRGSSTETMVPRAGLQGDEYLLIQRVEMK